MFSAACERNKGPILEVLRRRLPARATVLELGSGTGQHAQHFCASIEGLSWQPTELAPHLEMLRLLLLQPPRPEGLLEPLALDVREQPWPAGPFEAVFSANTAHIMPWEAVLALLAGAAQVLSPEGLLLLYGPFSEGGVHSAASNAAFDAELRARDPSMGVRDAQVIQAEAVRVGLNLAEGVDLPANNRMLIFRNGVGMLER
ncbi:DUF938 domain-containing protein [Cyanobium sp. ATX 6F1]|uniref:DUF938 domain-containing protein n=1 Tax=Cyanobium sp. ATX 6F1 TaxID=2823702 RepID=UPI0020CB8EB9|nr:DUF938 domain-containing protein [Cyanobium sp. ATX 6F1]MCP9915877.1 DUF938 domain-containing protein [Cyanobium sp. ATX 6F1]